MGKKKKANLKQVKKRKAPITKQEYYNSLRIASPNEKSIIIRKKQDGKIIKELEKANCKLELKLNEVRKFNNKNNNSKNYYKRKYEAVSEENEQLEELLEDNKNQQQQNQQNQHQQQQQQQKIRQQIQQQIQQQKQNQQQQQQHLRPFSEQSAFQRDITTDKIILICDKHNISQVAVKAIRREFENLPTSYMYQKDKNI